MLRDWIVQNALEEHYDNIQILFQILQQESQGPSL
jgi:hypothetical protein